MIVVMSSNYMSQQNDFFPPLSYIPTNVCLFLPVLDPFATCQRLHVMDETFACCFILSAFWHKGKIHPHRACESGWQPSDGNGRS